MRSSATKNNIWCPTPNLCGSATHAPRSRAAAKCAARSHSPARAALAAAPPYPSATTAGEGWVLGTVHPTGGYDEVVVSTSSGDQGWEEYARVETYLRAGKRHRADGPAVVSTDVDGYAVQEWWRQGLTHRGDGPALVGKARGDNEFWCRGEHLGPDDDEMRYQLSELVENGANPTDVVGWLAYPADPYPLIEAGVSPDAAMDAVDAGVDAGDFETIRQVNAGTLPLSWAAAGR